MSHSQLGLREKLGYGMGDGASNMYFEFFGIFVLYYYVDIVGLDPVAVGTMFLVTKVIDAVTDPTMGLIADRTRTRWGRFRPYLLVMAIPYGLSGYLVFLDIGTSPGQKLAYAYAAYSFMMLSYTAINVPYSGLLGVIHPSTDERAKATFFRFLIAGIGIVLVAAFATPLTTLLGGGNEALGIRTTMMFIAMLATVMFVVCFLTTRERITPTISRIPVTLSIKDLFGNKAWRSLAITICLAMTALLTHLSIALYYLRYVLGADETAVFWIFDRPALFFVTSSSGFVAGTFVARALIANFGKLRVMRWGLAGYAVSCLSFYFVPADKFTLACLCQALSMIAWSMVMLSAFAMYTDCAEFNEWRTERQSTGLVIAASLFAMKLGNALGGALPGYLLGYFGFAAGEEQSARATHGLAMIFSIVPASISIAALLAFSFYRLDRATMLEVEVELRQRRLAVVTWRQRYE